MASIVKVKEFLFVIGGHSIFEERYKHPIFLVERLNIRELFDSYKRNEYQSIDEVDSVKWELFENLNVDTTNAQVEGLAFFNETKGNIMILGGRKAQGENLIELDFDKEEYTVSKLPFGVHGSFLQSQHAVVKENEEWIIVGTEHIRDLQYHKYE